MSDKKQNAAESALGADAATDDDIAALLDEFGIDDTTDVDSGAADARDGSEAQDREPQASPEDLQLEDDLAELLADGDVLDEDDLDAEGLVSDASEPLDATKKGALDEWDLADDELETAPFPDDEEGADSLDLPLDEAFAELEAIEAEHNKALEATADLGKAPAPKAKAESREAEPHDEEESGDALLADSASLDWLDDEPEPASEQDPQVDPVTLPEPTLDEPLAEAITPLAADTKAPPAPAPEPEAPKLSEPLPREKSEPARGGSWLAAALGGTALLAGLGAAGYSWLSSQSLSEQVLALQESRADTPVVGLSDTRLEQLTERVDGLETGVETLNQRLVAQSNLGQAQPKSDELARLEQQVETFAGDLALLSGSLQQLSGQLSQVTQNVETRLAAIAAASAASAAASQAPAIPAGWVVNLVSFKTRAAAGRWQTRANRAGFSTLIIPATVDGQRWYRVSIAGFDSLKAAKASRLEANSRLGLTSTWISKR